MNKTRRRKQRERRKWERAHDLQTDRWVYRMSWIGGNGRRYYLYRLGAALAEKPE